MERIKVYLYTLLIGSLLVNCNSEADNLGSQFFGEGEGKIDEYDLVVYNVNNEDKVRSDSYALQRAVVGAFTEPQFGTQKVSYVTQIRLSSYSPNFGKNPVVDSVILEFQPEYYSNKDSIRTSSSKVNYNGVDADKTVTFYKPIKYGKNKTLTIKVSEVIKDLGTVGKEIYSDENISEGSIIGERAFDGNITSVEIKRVSDGSSLLSRKAGIRVSLDKDFFQAKIMSKNGLAELATENGFLSYFKGIKLFVDESDGYLMNFVPNNMSLRMYYTSGDADNRVSSSYDFNLGYSNVHFSQITYNRSNTFRGVLSNSDKENGDPLLYMQGMGGPAVGVKLSGSSIDKLKAIYKENRIAILSAKIRLHTDSNVWDNNYAKPTSFLVKELGSSDFITDLKEMSANVNYRMVTAYAINSKSAYYDIDITKTVKNIVEQGIETKDLVINIGDYLRPSSGILVSEAYNSNVYSPYRVILVGTDGANDNRAKLLVTSIAK